MSEPSWELLGGGGVLGPAGIDYVGAWAAGVAYQPGQIVTYNGVDYIACNPSTAQTPPFVPPFSRPAYGTSLPASPADGQEAILVDSVTNPSYQWRFRFNAGSSSAYKWEFVGGSAQRAAGGAFNIPTTQTSPANLGGPTTPSALAIPRAGVYRYGFGCDVYNGGTFVGAYATLVQVFNGATAVGDVMELRHHPSAYDGATISLHCEVTLAASASLNLRAWLDRAGSNSTLTLAWLEVLPARVA